MRAGFISLIGRPNAGKSTLLNRVIGTKLAIVSDKPQTTRNRILAVRNYPGAQAVFFDTPGIHRPLYRMNRRMVDAALESLRQVDVLSLIVDASQPTGKGDEFVTGLLATVASPVVLALNKIDLVAKPRLLPLIDWYRARHDFAEVVPVSALTGDGVDRLERALLDRLPEGEPLYPDDYLTDRPERFFAAELVREQVLHHTRDEIPYTSAVVVDQFEEPDEGRPLRLHCSIVVERDTQKAIVIGRGGQMIKRIGTDAREELERFFGTRVYLDLRVRARPGWRDDDRLLDASGIERRTRERRGRGEER